MEQLERQPTDSELAAALGIKVSELESYQTEAQPRQLVSLDEMSENAQGEENLQLTERLPDPQAAKPDAGMLSAENQRLMLQCLAALPKTQATVIVLHYLQNIQLREVAETLAVTPSRVSQLHRQALDRMRRSWRRSQALV